MSERKRKHDAATVEKFDSERKVIIPTKDSRSSAVVANSSSCAPLPPGIIAKIGTYLKLSPFVGRWSRKSLTSFCSAVGPHVSSYIRKAYLENNLTYLGYLEETLVQGDGRCLSEKQCALAGEKLRQWMSYNPWWRDACQYPTTFNQEEQEGKVPTIYKHISIKPFASVKDGQLFVDELIRTASGHIAIPLDLCENARIGKPFDEKYNVVISVNGNSYSALNMLEFDDEILAPDLEKEIHVMFGAFDLFFRNPVVSINLGVLDLLQFQLEELKL